MPHGYAIDLFRCGAGHADYYQRLSNPLGELWACLLWAEGRGDGTGACLSDPVSDALWSAGGSAGPRCPALMVYYHW
jgi:hypothetical protein